MRAEQRIALDLLDAQAQRMLQDPKAQRSFDFFAQWLRFLYEASNSAQGEG